MARCYVCGTVTSDYFDALCFYKHRVGKYYDRAYPTIIEFRKYGPKKQISTSIWEEGYKRFRLILCHKCARILFREYCSICEFRWMRGDPTYISDLKELKIKIKEYVPPREVIRRIPKPHPMAPRPGGNIVGEDGSYWYVKEAIGGGKFVYNTYYVCSGYEWTLAKLGYIK